MGSNHHFVRSKNYKVIERVFTYISVCQNRTPINKCGKLDKYFNLYSEEFGHPWAIISPQNNSKKGSCCSYRIHITGIPQLWCKFLHNWNFGWGDNYFQVFCQLFSKVLFKTLCIITGTISANRSEYTCTHSEQTPVITNQHSNADWISLTYTGILIRGRNLLPLEH